MRSISYIFLAGLLFTACVHKPTVKLKSMSLGAYQESEFSAIAAWQKEDFEEAFRVFKKTCKRTKNMNLYKDVCQKATSLIHVTPVSTKAFFERNFTPFISISKKSLATGYFEPFLEGSTVQSPAYPYPVYGVPSDLLRIELASSYKKRLHHPLRGRLIDNKVHPYYTREQINEDGLMDETPICYVNDRVDLFFLQVQGSGCIRLENEEMIYVGYADQNGYPYVSIGKEMIKEGLLSKEEVSLESIRSYLYANADERDRILNLNPSYIFFETRSHSASGALGIVLEAGRSVAVDKKNIPLGMPMFISTTDPLNGEKYEKMVFAHDTGGAINGDARIDIFFGAGRKAKQRAGQMKNEVKLWMLVPNDYLEVSLSMQEVK